MLLFVLMVFVVMFIFSGMLLSFENIPVDESLALHRGPIIALEKTFTF